MKNTIPVNDEIIDAVVNTAKQEGLHLDKSSIVLGVKNISFTNCGKGIEYLDSEVTADDIKGILDKGLTPEPRSILEDMLSTGNREINEEMLQGLIDNGKVKSAFDRMISVGVKVENLNTKLRILGVPFLVEVSSQKPFVLRRIEDVDESVRLKTKNITIQLSGKASLE